MHDDAARPAAHHAAADDAARPAAHHAAADDAARPAAHHAAARPRHEALDAGARSGSMSSQSARNHTLCSSGRSANSTAMTSATGYDDVATTPASHAPPSLALLELVSHSASASALPASFDVCVSRKGGFVAVCSASQLWLLMAVGLPRLFARTLQVKRKPVAVDITEDGRLLAVLSRPSQVDLYDMHGGGDGHITKRRTISLVHEASSVVLSPDARILITGNKFGIEVMAIGPDVPETTRRTLSGPAGDALEFSDDGRTLLITGYARKSDGSALFVLPGLYDGPLTEEGDPIPQPPEAAWTGSVLFPESARIARQATLLPDADTGAFNELFAFNAEEDSWGIYDIACQRFTQRKMFLPDHQRWTRSEFVDDAMPAVSPNADLAAVALRMRGTTNIWIYEVPGWDYKPSAKTLLEPPIQPCFCIPIPKDDATLQEICVLRWVRLNANVQRLLAVGNSSVPPNESDVPGVPLGSQCLLIVLDFDKRKPAGSPAPAPVKIEYDLDPLCPGELLPEGSISFDREVELVRTRTIAQRRAQYHSSALARRSSRIGSTPVQRARTTAVRPPQRPRLPSEDSEELTHEEAQAMFEAPYDNQQPRSHMSLARAATVAAVSPANRRHLRALPFRPLEYRRADGHRELPHESDADNWVPPPPAYTATAAAAESVSLSHPDIPPVPRLPRGLSSGAGGIPPVPSLPLPLPLPLPGMTMNPTHLSPSNAYPRQPTTSPVHPASSPLGPSDRERRPCLLHPSTHPSPQSYFSQPSSPSTSMSPRRRSSATTTTTTTSSPQLHTATPLHIPSRRPTLGSRTLGLARSSTDIHPLLPPLDQPRRDSAPVIPVHRRALPNDAFLHAQSAASAANTPTIAHTQHSTPPPALPHPHFHESRNHTSLPLVQPTHHHHASQPGLALPLTAPPATEDFAFGFGNGAARAGQRGNFLRGSRSQPHLLVSRAGGGAARVDGGGGGGAAGAGHAVGETGGAGGAGCSSEALHAKKKKKKVSCVVM